MIQTKRYQGLKIKELFQVMCNNHLLVKLPLPFLLLRPNAPLCFSPTSILLCLLGHCQQSSSPPASSHSTKVGSPPDIPTMWEPTRAPPGLPFPHRATLVTGFISRNPPDQTTLPAHCWIMVVTSTSLSWLPGTITSLPPLHVSSWQQLAAASCEGVISGRQPSTTPRVSFVPSTLSNCSRPSRSVTDAKLPISI